MYMVTLGPVCLIQLTKIKVDQKIWMFKSFFPTSFWPMKAGVGAFKSFVVGRWLMSWWMGLWVGDYNYSVSSGSFFDFLTLMLYLA